MLIASSCSHTNKQLLQAEALVETAPDSAIAILNTYSYNKLSDKDKALYGLVYMQVLDKKAMPIEPDSLLVFAENYYKGVSDNIRLSACYLLRGKVFKSRYEYEKAMSCFITVSELVNNDYKLLGKVYINMADIHSFQSDFNIARLKYNKAFKYFKLAKMKQQSFYAQLFFAKTYSLENHYLKANTYYKNLEKQTDDSLLIGLLYQEMGQNYFKDKNIDSSLLYLQKAKNYPYIGINKALRLSYMARVYFELKNYDSAFYYAEETFKYQPEIRLQRESYRIMTNCEFIKGRTENVTKYMSRYVELGDSIYKLDKQTKGSYIETMYNSQKEAAKSRIWIWYLLISIVFIISGSVYLYITKHKRAELKLKLNDVNHSQQKAAIRKDIMMKKQTSLLTNIERIKTEQKLTEKGNAKFPERVKSIYNELLHIQDQALFFCEMDGALNSIVTKLKTKAPDIKDKELIWSCLHLLDVPTHDMLILLNYESVNSSKRMKGRLAHKLGLENATLLNDYLLQLLTND